jgi:tetratricopeptide (TPR) repeat protein
MLPLLQRALEIDPDYVPALEWLGSANHDRHNAGLIRREEFERVSQQVRQRVLELDPGNTTVIMVRAFEADMANDKERAAELFERALSEDASRSLVLRVAGSFAINIGKFDTAIRILKHSTAIDPLCYSCLYSMSRAYMYAGNYVAAVQMRQRYMAIGSGGGYHFGMIKLLQGDATGALAIYEAFPEDETMGMAGRVMAHHDLGDRESAESTLTELLSAENWQRNKLLAQAYAWMGQKDAAFEWLQLATAQDLTWARFGVFIPVFRNLHVDARWDEWRESIELSAERLDAIQFNPDLPE